MRVLGHLLAALAVVVCAAAGCYLLYVEGAALLRGV